jgi:hypothetical protein
MEKRTCAECGESFHGRADKKFSVGVGEAKF